MHKIKSVLLVLLFLVLVGVVVIGTMPVFGFVGKIASAEPGEQTAILATSPAGENGTDTPAAVTTDSAVSDADTAQDVATDGEDADQLQNALQGNGDVYPEGPRETVTLPPETAHKDYMDLYPGLYAERPAEWVIQENTVFITFDDGPSGNTEQILQILRDKGVKATFFVVCKSGEAAKESLRNIVKDGHTLAIHSATHDYNKIYASVSAFLEDFDTAYNWIYEATGVKPDIFRFPGGSKNSYNKNIHREISDEMIRRGFTYYDWNASAGDTAKGADAASVFANATAPIGRETRVILLSHDTKQATLQALPKIIDAYKNAGYRFAAMTNEDKPIAFNL